MRYVNRGLLKNPHDYTDKIVYNHVDNVDNLLS